MPEATVLGFTVMTSPSVYKGAIRHQRLGFLDSCCAAKVKLQFFL